MKQTAGTSLISELVEHEETVNIILSDSYRENGVYVHDAFNGKGTDSRVYYDFDNNVPVVVHDRKTGKGVK
ncbi:MAG: hypothetical protein IJY03_07100 [Prevotella sp.]|nr:hypothetical protein [Prevotella sp.]